MALLQKKLGTNEFDKGEQHISVKIREEEEDGG